MSIHGSLYIDKKSLTGAVFCAELSERRMKKMTRKMKTFLEMRRLRSSRILRKIRGMKHLQTRFRMTKTTATKTIPLMMATSIGIPASTSIKGIVSYEAMDLEKRKRP